MFIKNSVRHSNSPVFCFVIQDYNSNQNQAQASPSGTSSQRMPILSKVSPLVSVMAAAPLPSTSATQASIQGGIAFSAL